MKKIWSTICFIIVAMICLSALSVAKESLPAPAEVQKDTRCSVCGMYVAKYPTWMSQLHLSDNSVKHFDGVKDMMVYFFAPQAYGGPAIVAVQHVLVKDYYSQNWINGKEALYVTGSDVLGPMGHEFIPFGTRAAAENFLHDHKGNTILTFNEITSELVESMRKGHKMKGHMKKGYQHDSHTKK